MVTLEGSFYGVVVILALAVLSYGSYAFGYIRGYVQGCKETEARMNRERCALRESMVPQRPDERVPRG